jgi:methionyl-tRNA formyltransferase
MKESLRIIFMGTPDFAVESLRALVEGGKNVVAVITAPDKPKGRGRTMSGSPVKEFALSKDIPVLQPVNLKSEEFLKELAGYHADLQVVVAFRMLPVAVWNMPRLGTFNLHASLLPQYRGAAPIHWAIIHGEKKTGVTTFFLQHEIDTGKIIFQEEEPISENDTVGDVYERLMHKGAALVLKTVNAIEEGSYLQTDQKEDDTLIPAPKIFRETCEINWDQPVGQVHNFIRGLSPFPGAWTTIGGAMVKILKAHPLEGKKNSIAVGEWKSDQKSYLYFGTGSGVLVIDELQWEGKKKMEIEEFFRGNKITS